ncbi:MAG TPA: tRNA (adenosine(37)-N6)-threonylcarbamoyltransferase complex transferase subunit TsaD [Candidatus Paceibacterota bacterium]|nr:tRNA (adenosine(37)-N6)-threonylcarbamoyltransferase complex transferase subunit TsaD [Candidatus Paceibacterota bacterium]
MIILGVETSCDETSIAVLKTDGDGFTVLANVVSSQVKTHAPFGGVVPMLAAREHTRNIGPVFDMAVREAGLQDPRNEIDLIAVTRGPGLGPALLVGLTFARTLAMQWDKPIIGINHMEGHIYSNWLPPSQFSVSNFSFPVLNLLVSGGHTELILMTDHGEYERLGETQDDAVGEAFDKAARLLGLAYPGGPALSGLASSGRADAYALPRPMSKSGDLNFSYSGLKTAVLYLIRDLTRDGKTLDGQQKADIAASFQEAAVDVLIQKTRTAALEHKPGAILLSGGVSANSLLRERLAALGKELNIPVSVPGIAWTGDNAAMIAAAGYSRYAEEKTTGPRSWESVVMNANLRLGDTGAAS